MYLVLFKAMIKNCKENDKVAIFMIQKYTYK